MNMTNKLKYIFLLLLVPALYIGCSREKFAEMNTDPDDLLSINPETEFTSALLAINNSSFEYYYDHNRAMYYWTQSFVTLNGASSTVYDGSGNLNQRYSNFYNNVGNQLVDVQKLIEKMTGEQREKYTYLHAITYIPLAYYAAYVSDVQGSIAYSQAFQARYTGLLTPAYDTQEELFSNLQVKLDSVVQVLKSTPSVEQVNLSTADVVYGGDEKKWIRAANSLRLRLAMRLLNRDADKMKTLVADILSDDGGLISSNEENWQFVGGINFASGGNYNPQSNGDVSGSKNLIDFMSATSDPRIRIFFQKSDFTKDKFDSAKAQGKLPATLTWDGQLYRGQFANPSASSVSAYSYYFSDISYSYKGVTTADRWVSNVQDRLFYNPETKAHITFPVVTYADVCFMRAELAVRGITSEDASSLYTAGIEASIKAYDEMGSNASLSDYTTLSATEIATYLSQTGVAYDAANALEQICIQEYLNCFKNQNEAWATIKRTGYPSMTSSILNRETVVVDGDTKTMPRRFIVSYPSISDLNYTNRLNAIEEMTKDAGFSTPDDITGRVWWDTAN